MLFNIPWWAGLYILLLLLIVFMELKGITIEDDEKTTFVEYIIIISRYAYYTSMLLLSILFFQNIDSGILKILFLGVSIYSIPFGLWFTLTEVKDFIINPVGKDEESGEENGLISNAIGYSIPLTLYGGGLAFAIIGSLPLILKN